MFTKFKLIAVVVVAMLFSLTVKVDAERVAPDWSTNTLRVTSTGYADPAVAKSKSHAAGLAKRAAIVIAYRELLESVQGVTVEGETTVEQMMLQSDTIRAKVNGVVKGAHVVAEQDNGDGSYTVTVELPLFGGSRSLASAVIERPLVLEPLPVPAPSYQPPADYNPPPMPELPTPVPEHRSTTGNYTGLIVDCRNLGTLNPVMSPVIRDANGQKIYGHKNLDYDRIIREGMASYAQDMNMTERAGSKPLIVKAIRLDDLEATPVLSMEDTELVIYENSQSHFLENIAVVFLY